MLDISNLDIGWGNFSNSFQSADLVTLTFCADKLSAYYKEPQIPLDDLDRIYKEIRELLSETEQAEIDIQLKAIIIERLSELAETITTYPITGFKALENQITLNIGTYIQNFTIFEAAKDTKPVIGFKQI